MTYGTCLDTSHAAKRGRRPRTRPDAPTARRSDPDHPGRAGGRAVRRRLRAGRLANTPPGLEAQPHRAGRDARARAGHARPGAGRLARPEQRQCRIPAHRRQRHLALRRPDPGAGGHRTGQRLLGHDAAAPGRRRHGAGQPRLRAARMAPPAVGRRRRAAGRAGAGRRLAAHGRAGRRIPAREQARRGALVLARPARHRRAARPGRSGALLHRRRCRRRRAAQPRAGAGGRVDGAQLPQQPPGLCITWFGLAAMVLAGAAIVARHELRARRRG
ncbi:exported SurF1 family protein [Bordetella pertussis]|nr:exported SurF1 family protein [Bordetella pertussis]